MANPVEKSKGGKKETPYKVLNRYSDGSECLQVKPGFRDVCALNCATKDSENENCVLWYGELIPLFSDRFYLSENMDKIFIIDAGFYQVNCKLAGLSIGNYQFIVSILVDDEIVTTMYGSFNEGHVSDVHANFVYKFKNDCPISVRIDQGSLHHGRTTDSYIIIRKLM